MIDFLDTSALVKRYIAEPGSSALCERIAKTVVAVGPLAYAEAHATFARRLREGSLDPKEHLLIADVFESDWKTTLQVPVTPEVLALVPGLCVRNPLRGADAWQLAAVALLHAERVEVTFITSDQQLLAAARAEKIIALDPLELGVS